MGQCSIWVRHSLKRTVTGVQATGELSDLQRAQSVSSWVADTWAVRLHFSDGTNTSVESRNFKDVLVFFFAHRQGSRIASILQAEQIEIFSLILPRPLASRVSYVGREI